MTRWPVGGTGNRNGLATLAWALILYCGASAAEDVPPPAWLSHAGSLRASDPALAKGKGAVEWRAWSAEAFAEAARLSKPVYVFVTANWSHGGREMERTTLSDPALARRLNNDFVPIRMDRDAFPETDLRMQQAAAALKGVRGWPLNIFMSPDGEIFFASTFLALEDDLEFDRPGMRAVLAGLAQRWKDDRNRISREGGTFCRALKKNTEHATLRGKIPTDILNATATKLQEMFDKDNGGFRSPIPAQFPAPRALEACLAHFARTGDKKSLEVVEVTLGCMLDGGIYDQLEGGFHRFCTDRRWLAPRFEKTPLFNAEMISLLLHTWQATGSARYRTTAEECLNFWRGELDADGQFFCASIAPEARSFEDGAYYTWSLRELESLFAGEPALIRFASVYYDIGERGNQTHTAPDRSVLHVSRPLQTVARELGLSIEDARKSLERVRGRLRSARAARPPPPRDRTPLCDGNAMMAAAFLEAGRLLGRDELTAQGLKTLNAILTERVNELQSPRPVRHVLTDPSSVALAMDETARAWACTQAFETTSDPKFLQRAIDALERLDKDYRDLLSGGFIERSFSGPPDFAQALNWRTKSLQDTSEPSTNGLIAQLYARVYALAGDAKFLEKAKTTVEAVAAPLDTPSPYIGTLAVAADAVQNGVLRIKIIGRKSDPSAVAMLGLANARYFPWKSAMRFDTTAAAGETEVVNLKDNNAFAIVKSRGQKLIAESLEQLNKILNEAMQPRK